MSGECRSHAVSYRHGYEFLHPRGLAIVSKDRRTRIHAIADYLASSSYDIVCLQELWIYKDYEVVREAVQRNLPFSRFFHT